MNRRPSPPSYDRSPRPASHTDDPRPAQSAGESSTTEGAGAPSPAPHAADPGPAPQAAEPSPEPYAADPRPAPSPDHPHPAPDSPNAGTLHEVFRRRAAERPDAVALSYRGSTVSYRTLDRASDTLALELAARGVRPRHLVPVLLPRSPLLVAVLLGVLKAGAAYAAFDTRWPRARIAELTALCRAPLTVTAGDGEAGTAGTGMPAWCPDPDLSAAAAAAPDTAPVLAPHVSESDTCCVFFTSGSTGRPKGVLSPHAGTVRLLEPVPFADLGPGTVIPQAAPLPWDAAALELWSALLGGGTSVLVDEPHLTPDGLRALVRETGVNTVWLTASLLHLFVEEDLGCFTGIRQVLTGGERLSPPHAGRFVRAYPEAALINGYGPVETTVFATTHRVTAADCAAGPAAPPLPVGRPVPRTEVTVLDAGSKPCPPGVTGEICLSGAGLAAGYLGDPEQTRHAFVTTETGTGPHRVYRTGDLGHLTDDGVLHFAGRADRQVKVRGHRIEPAEVEAGIDAVPGVRRSAVVPLWDGARCTGLAAAYLTENDAEVTPEAVRATLAARFPAYLVPARLAELPAFPLTGTGKLDTAALRAQLTAAAPPDAAPAGAGSEGATRADAVRAEVAAAFAETLGLPGPVPHGTSFFALGGDSLDGARLCVRVGHRTGVPVPASVLVAGPTVDRIADWVGSRAGERAGTVAPDGPYELLPGQTAFLFGHQLDPADTSAHCLLAWRTAGPLDPAALRAAAEHVHGRHQALHARYVFDRRALALLDAAGPARAVDFRVLPAAPGPDAAREALHTVLLEPFDIAAGANWRCVAAPLGDEAGWLVGVAVHHIAFDGGSEHRLAAALSAAYTAHRTGGPLPAAPPPPLAAVLAGARAQSDTAALATQRAHWRDTLTGVPTLELPPPKTEPLPEAAAEPEAAAGPIREAPAGPRAEKEPIREAAAEPRSEPEPLPEAAAEPEAAPEPRALAESEPESEPEAEPAPDSDAARFRLDPRIWAALEAYAQRAGSTRFGVLLGAYAEALGAVTGQRDLAVGAPLARRYHPDTADAIGCLVDVVCFRLRPAGDGGTGRLPELLADIRTALTAQDIPFEEVVRLAADPARDRRRHPLFQTLFALHEAQPALALDGRTAHPVQPPAARALHEVEAEVRPLPEGGAEVTVGHLPEATGPATVARVATAYHDLLHTLAAAGHPSAADPRTGS